MPFPTPDFVFSMISLAAIVLAAIFMARQRLSYFANVKAYFIMAFLGFAALVGFSIYFHVNESLVTMRIGITSFIFVATATGLAATNLNDYPKAKSTKELFVALVKKPKLSVVVYLSVMLIGLGSTWFPQVYPNLPQASIALQYDLLSGETIYNATYEPWYATIILMILIAFWTYPSINLLFLSKKVTSEKVRNAVRILSICLVIIAGLIFIFDVVVGVLGYHAHGLAYLLNSAFFCLIAYSFRETTTLSVFIEYVSPHPPFHIGEGDHVVAFYTSKSDKMKVLSAFIYEGLVNGDKIFYVFPDSDAGFVEGLLKKNGVDVKRCVKSGSLTMLSTSEWYRGGVFDHEVISKKMLKEKRKAREAGYKHLRRIIDYGDLHRVFKDTSHFFAELRKSAGGVVQPFLITLRTFNVEALSQEEIRWLKEYGIRNLFMCEGFSVEMLDVFAQRLGLKHDELVGKKILFEFDTASNYERAVEGFILEGRTNGESVIIFTRRGSGLQLNLAKQTGLKFFHLTAQVSVPTTGASENEILLPANDTSLLLDALNNVVKIQPYWDTSLVFDSLSDLLLAIGFEKTYNFTRYALEMLSSPRITALFLLNPNAHDPKIASSLRNLFNSQITYGEKGLQIIKLPKSSLHPYY